MARWFFLTAVLLLVAPARATEALVAIAVERRESALDCPLADALTARVAHIRHLPEHEQDGAAESVRVDVRFERSGGVYGARLEFGGARRGERQLEDRSGSCSALAEAVAVAIALTVDRDDQADAPPRASDSAASNDGRSSPNSRTAGRRSGASPPASTPLAASVAAPSDRAAKRWRIGAWLAGGAGFAFGSPLSVAVSSRVRAVHGPVSLEFGVHTVLPDTVAAGDARFETSWLFGDVGVCRILGRDYSLSACVALAVGRARGRGLSFSENRSVNLFWIAPETALSLRGPLLGPIAWNLSATLWIPLRELTFSVENSVVVWRSSPVSAMVGAGAGADFD